MLFLCIKEYSEYANYYGKSDIFTKQSYIDNILKHLPIVLKDGKCKKYYNLIYNNYSIKKFNNELVANSNISSETRDLFYGTDDEVNDLIKQLKKLDKDNNIYASKEGYIFKISPIGSVSVFSDLTSYSKYNE